MTSRAFSTFARPTVRHGYGMTTTTTAARRQRSMATRPLRVSPSLSLPSDFVTKTAAILAQRRKGKSYTASIIAEELVASTLPFVLLDPTGAHWGLRASADALSEGLPVVILGGAKGDVPVGREDGAFVANLVVEHPGYYIVDFSLFESGRAAKQFATEFAESLYRLKLRPGKDFPLHIVVDEANRFVPQTIRNREEADQRMLGAFETLVLQGGLRGIGTTLVSQRAAIVNKNVLEQIDMLIVLRVVGPNDQDAIRDYIRAHGTLEERREMMDSLASLDIGEAWFWEPGGDPPLFQRVRIRERRTFNSSATPKPGVRAVIPKRLAPVDIEALREQMAEAIERAEANDPEALRRQVAQLKRELAAAKRAGPLPKAASAAAKVETVVKEVKVPWPDKALVARAEAAATRIERGAAKMSAALAGGATVAEGFAGLGADLRKLLAQGPPGLPPATAPAAGSSPRAVAIGGAPSSRGRRPSGGASRPPRTPPAPPPAEANDSGEPVQIKAGAIRILKTLARHYPLQLTRTQLATLSGFRIGKGSGTWDTYISALKRAGYIDTSTPGMILITEAGLAAAGVTSPEPMSTDEVLAMWMERLKAGARRMLDALVEAYPEEMTPEELGERSGLTVPSGTFDTYFSTLKRNGLIDVNGAQGQRTVRASGSLFVGTSA